MQRFQWLFAPPVSSVMFALRLCIAMASALYLAMWLQLERPYWSALEVAVMIQPVAGMAVVRGFARAVGTVVAGGMGLAIMAAFAQSYVLSAAALALWVAACSFGASLLRNNLSYGFAIAGFVTGITVVLSHTIGQSPFNVAVGRTEECLLAAVVTATVNVLLSPPIAVRMYFNSRIGLLRDLAAALARVARPARADSEADDAGTSDQANPNDPHPALYALIGQSLALEQTRQYVRYESPAFATFDRLARRLNYDLIALISAISSLQLYVAKLAGPVDRRPLDELAEPARRLQNEPHNPDAIKQAFEVAYQRITDIARSPGRPSRLADWVVLSRALDLANRCQAALVKHQLLIAEREAPSGGSSRRSEFSLPLEYKNAFRNSARTLIAVGAGAAIWVDFHDQLPTTLLVIMLSALTTIFATLPNPVAAAGGFAKGVAAAAVAAFFVDFAILPQANSYAMLMLAIMPVVFIGGLAMATPNIAIALPGRISMTMFSVLVHVQNGSLMQFSIYMQILMGIVMAVTFTALSFKLVLPVSPRQVLRERLAGVFGELAHGARDTRERFETRMYDRLNRLPTDDSDDPAYFGAHQAAMASVNIGLEARALVVLVERAGFADDVLRAVEKEMTGLQAIFTQKPPSLTDMIAGQHATLALAQRMIEDAVAVDDRARRRLAIRAAVAAELVSSALADYTQAMGWTPPHPTSARPAQS